MAPGAYWPGRIFTDESVTTLDSRRLFGQEGESAAEQYLRHKGYQIVARNLRSSVGELDLVAEDGQVLVFVEVKARRSDVFGGAIHAVHQRKQQKLILRNRRFLKDFHLRDLQAGNGYTLFRHQQPIVLQ